MSGELRRQLKVPGEVALTSGHPIMSGLNLILDEKRFRRSLTATGLPPQIENPTSLQMLVLGGNPIF